MQFSHDKHQYFFEKYLRKEMLGDELELFERKLRDSESFREAFDFYSLHRSEIVAEELAEYDQPELMIKKPQRWGWVYFTLSLVCLVLILDFYISDSYNKEQRRLRIPLIDKIHVFDKMPEPISDTLLNKPTGAEKRKVQKPITEVDSLVQANNINGSYSQLINGKSVQIEGDYFVSDSLFRVLESKLVSERLNKLKVETDSLISDTTLQELVMQSFFMKPNQIARQLLVEYWDSPLHFRGYVFNGKKILIYDIKVNESFYLSFSEANNSYYLILKNRAYYLFPDQHFHKLGVE